jgi:hypothetical protein
VTQRQQRAGEVESVASAKVESRWWANRLESPNSLLRRSLFVIEHRSKPLRPAVPTSQSRNKLHGLFSSLFSIAPCSPFLGYFVMGTEGGHCCDTHFLTLRLPNLALSHTSASAADPDHGLSRKEAASWQRSGPPSYGSISHNETGLQQRMSANYVVAQKQLRLSSFMSHSAPSSKLYDREVLIALVRLRYAIYKQRISVRGALHVWGKKYLLHVPR